MMNWKLGLLSLTAVMIFMGCSKEEPDPGPDPLPSPFSKLIIKFRPNVNGVDLNASDTLIYTNLPGNIYSVSSLKFLVSDIRLNDWDYNNFQLGQHHLVDVSDETTLTWEIEDSIIARDYSSVSLFLGFREDNNVTGKFPDLDNDGWGWPAKYGGGYYTLRMQGHYLDDEADATEDPYAIALGGKKLVETQTDTSYKPNELVASLPNSGFPVVRGTKLVVLEISFDINNLFQSAAGDPNFDLATYNAGIEDNAKATNILSLNIVPSFSMGSISYNKKPE